MNFRFDALYGVPIIEPESVVKIAMPDPGPPTYMGFRVLTSDLACRPEDRFDVVCRLPIARRKRYFVRKRQVKVPTVIFLRDVFYVHPSVYVEMLALMRAEDDKRMKP